MVVAAQVARLVGVAPAAVAAKAEAVEAPAAAGSEAEAVEAPTAGLGARDLAPTELPHRPSHQLGEAEMEDEASAAEAMVAPAAASPLLCD